MGAGFLPSGGKWGGTFWGVLAAGLGLRLAIASTSLGSTDILLWQAFAARIAEDGLLGRYGELQVQGFPMNHPPLAALGAAAVRSLALASGIGFALLFKLPMLTADVAIAAGLGVLAGRNGRPSPAIAGAYAFSPLAIAISAYHGNTDCLATALALASAALLSRGRALAAGIAIGAALNVKLVPILVLPALALALRDATQRVRFAVGLACTLVPFVPYVVAQPVEFYRATLGHGSELNLWGPTALLWLASDGAGPIASPLLRGYARVGVPVMLAAIAALCLANLWRPRLPLHTLCAGCFVLFLAVAPGFGLQYLVYPLPFLLLADRRYGLAYSIAAGVFAFAVYVDAWTGAFPPYSSLSGDGYPLHATLIGLVAWAVLVGWLVQTARRLAPRRRGFAPSLP